MNYRPIYLSALTAAGVSALLPAWGNHGRKTAADKRPNIIYILADDMGYGDIRAFNPQSSIPTPCLDRMIAEGMHFTEAHSNASVSTPTRYGTLTGRYCFRSRLKSSVLVGLDSALIEPGRMTVASLLRDNGYHTACIGKWHLGLNWQRRDPSKPLFTGNPWHVENTDNVAYENPVTGGPNDHGFDYSYIIPASLGMPPYVYLENGVATAPVSCRIGAWDSGEARGTRFRDGDAATDFDPFTCLDRITEKSIAFIRDAAQKEKPFFLYFALTSPHTPWLPSAKFRGISGAGPYGDFVCMTDDVVARIYRILEETGQSKNTLVIFTSDNGAAFWPEDIAVSGHRANHIFSGMKSDLLEGGHRIPMIAMWPGRIAKGSVCDDVVCSTDLLATCAELVGRELPADAGEDSFSYLGALMGTSYVRPLRPATIHHSDKGYFAIRKGDWVLLDCHGSGGWTLDEKDALNLPPRQLYNIREDITEQKNLADKFPDITSELHGILKRCISDGRSRDSQ